MSTPTLSTNVFSGRLIQSPSGWVLLEVPNALVRGAFSALAVPGIELPPTPVNQKNLRAHISVMRPEELEAIGGASKITEIGQQFGYRLGPLKEVRPSGWKDMEKVWFFSVVSPDLVKLRKSYGLSGLPMRGEVELPFHITVAVRRKNVLRQGPVSKSSALVEAYLAAVAAHQ